MSTYSERQETVTYSKCRRIGKYKKVCHAPNSHVGARPPQHAVGMCSNMNIASIGSVSSPSRCSQVVLLRPPPDDGTFKLISVKCAVSDACAAAQVDVSTGVPAGLKPKRRRQIRSMREHDRIILNRDDQAKLCNEP